MSKNTHDPMKSYLADRHIMQKTDALKAELDRLKEAADAAEAKLKVSSKTSRDAARAQARRAQFVGEVYLVLAADNPSMWMDFRPSLDSALAKADDDLLAVFGLEPKPKVDTEEGSKAAATVDANEKTEGKKEGEGATVEQPVDPHH